MVKSPVEKAALELSRLEKIASAISAKEKKYFEYFLKTNYDLDRAVSINLDRAAAVVKGFYGDLALAHTRNEREGRAVAIRGKTFIITNGGFDPNYDDQLLIRDYFDHISSVRGSFESENLLIYPEFPSLDFPIPRLHITDVRNLNLKIYYYHKTNRVVSTATKFTNSTQQYLCLKYQELDPLQNTVIRIIPSDQAELLLLSKKE